MVAVERAVAALDPHGPPDARGLAGVGELTHATRIGLFSGSFNPLTLAHVAVADAACAQAGLDALVWAQAVVTVDKERVTRASLPDRLAQLVAFARTRGESVLVLNRGLYAEQVQTIRTIVGNLMRHFVVVGFDKVVQIFDPRYYADRDGALAELFVGADLLVAPRADAGARELAQLLAQPGNQPYADHVAMLDVPPVYRADSSTEVRQLAADPDAHQVELARLVPPEALALIATRAYAANDAYPLRQAWLSALQPLPQKLLRSLPSLVELVRLVAPSGASSPRDALLDAQAHPSRSATLTLLRSLGVLGPGVA
jgi:nicotinic acid mononucleotide adenylyltransferase